MSTDLLPSPLLANEDPYTTLEVARMLGLAVRSVQLMVDRGDLDAWKTPGGHRRIARDSVLRWRDGKRKAALLTVDTQTSERPAGSDSLLQPDPEQRRVKVLLIEDSMHFQNLVTLLVRRQFPQIDLQTANDGIAGLIMAGQLQPDVLMVDLLLPGIDGATLLAGLRAHPLFDRLQVMVITSLEPSELAPYEFALDNVPVVHKPRLVTELPPLLRQCLQQITPRA